ncbi:MAG: hypothetical protein P2975_06955 [Gemmatimonadota bacterium]|jgi:hypothetical protein|nr:hypothetical protein [Gemmatimonadota bacterium]MDQ8151121.1 hypothetical protein [Gemmatimonadota bacterium]MDQ8152776.1 hypothetical protein [Gemmatimonadota bacterium]MDQ8169823.1 hypothetical protein [Gemmatimonadota bacterium]MDQ8174906.1 hypothetical protein [Gemmatimonadota bacterium]
MTWIRRPLAALCCAVGFAAPITAVAAQRSALADRFIRDQTVLGVTVYGPAFALAVADDAISGAAAYLVMAGGSFFASAEATRRVEITEARYLLSRAMATRTTGNLVMLSSLSGSSPRRVAGVALLGGLGGTAAGLAIGGGLTAGEAAATVFGHDLAYLSAVALTTTSDPDPFDERSPSMGRVATTWTLAGLGGYAVGRLYAGNTDHQVTVGDVETLWLTAGIGALAGATAVADAEAEPQTRAMAMLGGALVGTVVGERTLVRRRDLTPIEGRRLALGAGAGALMGIGIGVLTMGEAEASGSRARGFATAGAIGGLVLTERYLQPVADAGRYGALSRLRVDPIAIASTLTGRAGRHALLAFTF